MGEERTVPVGFRQKVEGVPAYPRSLGQFFRKWQYVVLGCPLRKFSRPPRKLFPDSFDTARKVGLLNAVCGESWYRRRPDSCQSGPVVLWMLSLYPIKPRPSTRVLRIVDDVKPVLPKVDVESTVVGFEVQLAKGPRLPAGLL